MMVQAQPLDLQTLPLGGVHLIEASAGTGKTFSLTRLVLRLLLVRQLPIEQVLMVTFTKAATEELRARVALELRRLLARWDDSSDDAFINHLKTVAGDQQAGRILLQDALLRMDQAPVFTIHSFCKRVLTQQAFASGMEFDLSLETDQHELTREAVTDWYRTLAQDAERFQPIAQHWPTPADFIQEYRRLIEQAHLPLRAVVEDAAQQQQLMINAWQQLQATWPGAEEEVLARCVNNRKKVELAEQWQGYVDALADALASARPLDLPAVINPLVRQLNSGKKAQGEALQQWLQALADYQQQRLLQARHLAREGVEFARAALQQAKRRLKQLDFNDLIVRLREALEGPQGEQLAQSIRAQYPVAMVDEFQDTDPDQYSIFRTLYVQPPTTPTALALYMIGDPKQAIYSFRGGDIHAYLRARTQCDAAWYLDTNWRSTAPLIAAYNRLFAQHPSFFDFGIDYHQVNAGGQIAADALSDPEQPAALVFPWFAAEQPGKANPQSFRSQIARWCATEIQRLLTQAQWRQDDQQQPLQPSDIAILVRQADEAEDLLQALAEQGIAAVYLSQRDSVFHSLEAQQLWRALQGIVYVEHDQRLLTALATPLFGLAPTDLLALRDDDARWEQWRYTCLQLRQRWQQQGFIQTGLTLLHRFYRAEHSAQERALTNYLHLMELLQQEANRRPQPQQLLDWLADAIHQPQGQEVSELRLESDQEVVRIITHHGSKGLQYPVVFLPFFCRSKDPTRRMPSYARVHDADHAPVIDMNPGEATQAERVREQQAEERRLFYVAVTRAVHRCYIAATPFNQAEQSPLGTAVAADNPDDLEAKLQHLCNDHCAKHEASVMTVQPPSTTVAARVASETSRTLAARPFTGSLDDHWRLTSFTQLNRGGSGHDDPFAEHEDDAAATDQPGAAEHTELPLRFTLAPGIRTGIALHGLLEPVDFTQPNWADGQEYLHPLRQPLEPLPEAGSDALIAWLEECLATPLLPHHRPDLSLSQLHWHDTLREVEFYYPLASFELSALQQLLAEDHADVAPSTLPPGKLEGMMRGFIDLVFVWRGRYYLADYKSNHLGHTWADYATEALNNNIVTQGYDIQRLIYSLALHRYLRQRLPDYQPERHLGGVFYLYLRGMHPAQPGCGIHFWQPTPALLEQLDRLFQGEAG